ncbi:nucleotidyltransferase family protein [Primorskyibacter aestuariivivens]|uniref:nucleotidyltransferase family protein n=1 Tax=Primorskyibacter aestuariivivens TaxID=1888912 RepID=UPI002301AC0B|nr:nucleotidyltransferase family protein [Primorskyibacter aestuariivivens]MDA7429852.1 nucleotidyltransferase family protein [Primorskyibacter aestuariivivens]
MQTALILLAAGSSTRMRGADKLLQDVGGMACVKAMALRGLAAGMQVIVTLPARDHPRAVALAETPVLRLPVPEADQGMAQSLRAGIAALPDGTEAAMILPADMPGLEADDLRAVIDEARTHPEALIVQAATEDGTPGHPVLFRAPLFAEISALTGDTGAREVIARHSEHRRLVKRPGSAARLDLDTPEDWAAWRAGQAARRD